MKVKLFKKKAQNKNFTQQLEEIEKELLTVVERIEEDKINIEGLQKIISELKAVITNKEQFYVTLQEAKAYLEESRVPVLPDAPNVTPLTLIVGPGKSKDIKVIGGVKDISGDLSKTEPQG